MSYTALYRKFRPVTFSEVKGQDHIVTTLRNQIRAGRIGHAYLFCGTRGTGKTTVAKILARTVNCEHPAEDGSPCNECPTCQSILKGTSNNVIEIDAASNNGVDNIREIIDEVAYRPTQGRYKVYIIDEVHMLSTGAFNALLKTLEEPPEYVIFILATTEVNKIPVTILSRCQRYNFHRISIDTIADRLTELLEKENVRAEEKAVRYIARTADGSMRDALSLLDECIAFYLGEELTYDKVLNVLGTVDTDVFSHLLRLVIDGDASGAIRVFEKMVVEGKEVSQFVNDFTWYLRNLLLVQSSDDLEDVLDVSTENLAQLREESRMIDSNVLMRYIHIFSDLANDIRYASQKRILTEVALIRLCRPETDTDMNSILDRIRVLEKKIESGVVAAPARGGGSTGAEAAVKAEAPERKQESEEKPKAPAPEDLRKLVGRWGTVRGMASGILKSCLAKAKPRYDGDTGEAMLYLEVTERMCFDLLQEDDNQQDLAKILNQVAGKAVPFKIVLEGQAEGRNLADLPLEEKLSEEIDFPIHYE